MNQINLDSLLHIGSTVNQTATTSPLAPLKLSPDTLYQGLLNIGRDGSSQLQMSTPQGPVQIKLTPQQTALVLAGQNTTAVMTPQGVSSGEGSASNQSQALNQSALSGFQQNTTNNVAGQIKLNLAIQQLPSGQIQLQVQLQTQPQQTPFPTVALTAAQLLDVMGAKGENNQLQLVVQLKRVGNQLLVQLPNQRQLQLPLSFLPQSKNWPEQQPLQALLQLEVKQHQLQIKLQLTAEMNLAGTDKAANKTPTTAATIRDAASHAVANTGRDNSSTNSGTTGKEVLFSSAQNRELAPLLAKALLNTNSAELPKAVMQLLTDKTPAAQATKAQWQLQGVSDKNPDKTNWQLQISPATAKTAVLELSPNQLNRPLLWQAKTTEQQVKTTVDVAPLWRQWLPLSGAKADPLRVLPDLPAAVNAVLTELKTQTLDVARPIQSSQLAQQLNAALQFNPLQAMPENMASSTGTSAGTLAVALQLLLGRLAGLTGPEPKTATAAKLQQLIGQLDTNQSSNLLRQLSSHSSTLQGSQFATVEQQQQPQQNQQLFIQLPLQQQGDSRFAELAISEREGDGKGGSGKTRQWQLTMKFDLAELGPLLVQVRLTGQDVSLQFYAEQEKVVSTAQQFLPLFKDRLKLQGLSVSEAQCQLGKIPPQLYQRSNSLLAIKV
ncbi:flagellar hook-length control protein FliK [Rheinheimera sp.]|uniref:flagellar hook-length control protein FliK n=1 Tax=Rheinheimera sp. TaxID=1869214 RepID=UPI0027BAA0A1|nr:flagellar hook-length control protein FliK [Rheinheimera sp.]